MLTLVRVFKSVGSSLWRNRLTAFFSVLGLSLVFFLVHLSTFVGLISDLLITNLERKVDIAVFIEPDATEIQTMAFRNKLDQWKAQGAITSYWELPKEEALEEFIKRYPSETQFLQNYDLDNPLSSVFGIVPAPDPLKAEQLLAELRSDIWNGLIDPKTFELNAESKTRVQEFLSVTKLAKQGVSVFWIIFLGVSFFLVFYTVSLMIKSNFREMTVMRLVGANMSMIRAPFIIEGLVIALIALLLSLLVFWWTAALTKTVFLNLVSRFEIKSNFLTDFFSGEAAVVETMFQNSVFLLLCSFVAALLAVEYSLQKKDLFTDV